MGHFHVIGLPEPRVHYLQGVGLAHFHHWFHVGFPFLFPSYVLQFLHPCSVDVWAQYVLFTPHSRVDPRIEVAHDHDRPPSS